MNEYVVLLHDTESIDKCFGIDYEVQGVLMANHDVAREVVLNELASIPGVEVINDFWINNSVVVNIENETLVSTIENLSYVDKVEKSPEIKLLYTPNVTETWGINNIRAPQARTTYGVTGQGVRIGVLDTGIRHTHQALVGSLVTTDPSNSRYPGGWMDFDYQGNTTTNGPRDGHGHGTHVSGTIAGRIGAFPRVGVAPGAMIVSGGLLAENGTATQARALGALQWMVNPTYVGVVTNTKPVAVNNSWGSAGPSQTYRSVVRSYEGMGILFTAAAGNSFNGTIGHPADVEEALAVGAYQSSGDVANFSSGRTFTSVGDLPSNYRHRVTKPEVSAPGVGVYSAYEGSNGSYTSASGTSMANPHVCGVIALMCEANPNLTPAEIRHILIGTSRWRDMYSQVPETDTRMGRGMIDAYAAVTAAVRLGG